jgi:NADH-quinone oxidoreductase subunit A
VTLSDYTPLLIVFAVTLGLGGVLIAIGRLAGPRRPSATKMMPFEGGSEAIGSARQRFPVKFYLVALLFIVFDVEAVFIYPWAVLFKESVAAGRGLMVLVEMVVFMAVLGAGLAFVWRKGALEWE